MENNVPGDSSISLDNTVRIGPPPDSLHLDTFYKKYLDASGIPIVSSDQVPDSALITAEGIVRFMLQKRDDIRKYLVSSRSRVMIMGQHEMEMDLPERRNMKKPERDYGGLTPDERENYDKPGGIASMTAEEYWNKRVRGMGGSLTSCAEENLMAYKTDGYYGENILVHEFAHTIMNAILNTDPSLYAEIENAYQAALDNGLYKGQYAINTKYEYWAEGTQWWFWTNFEFYDNGVRVQSPEDLKNYDPTLYELLSRVYEGNRIPADRYYAFKSKSE